MPKLKHSIWKIFIKPQNVYYPSCNILSKKYYIFYKKKIIHNTKKLYLK